MNTEPIPIATETGDKIKNEKIPVWYENGVETPMKDLKNEELVEKYHILSGKINKHNLVIVSHQESIIRITELQSQLAREATKRDLPVILAEFNVTKL